MIDISQLPSVGLFSFGAVWIIDYVAKKYFRKTLDTTTKLILMGVIAFGVGYVPAELANELANRIKVAIEIAVSFTGFYQGGKKIAESVSK